MIMTGVKMLTGEKNICDGKKMYSYLLQIKALVTIKFWI